MLWDLFVYFFLKTHFSLLSRNNISLRVLKLFFGLLMNCKLDKLEEHTEKVRKFQVYKTPLPNAVYKFWDTISVNFYISKLVRVVRSNLVKASIQSGVVVSRKNRTLHPIIGQKVMCYCTFQSRGEKPLLKLNISWFQTKYPSLKETIFGVLIR